MSGLPVNGFFLWKSKDKIPKISGLTLDITFYKNEIFLNYENKKRKIFALKKQYQNPLQYLNQIIRRLRNFLFANLLYFFDSQKFIFNHTKHYLALTNVSTW